jgi:hypothetical protein
MSPSTFHKIQESAGQLANPSGLVKPDRFSGDQFTPYTECNRSSLDQYGMDALC